MRLPAQAILLHGYTYNAGSDILEGFHNTLQAGHCGLPGIARQAFSAISGGVAQRGIFSVWLGAAR